MESIRLFYLESPDIKISIDLRFNEKGQLFFDGDDIGKTVAEIRGDWDYEYTYKIEPEEVDKFYKILNVTRGDRIGLLQSLKQRFGVNQEYSLLGEFMNAHLIKYDRFTWT